MQQMSGATISLHNYSSYTSSLMNHQATACRWRAYRSNATQHPAHTASSSFATSGHSISGGGILLVVAANPPAGRASAAALTSSSVFSGVSAAAAASGATFGGRTVVYGTVLGMRSTRSVTRDMKRGRGRCTRCLVMWGSRKGRPSCAMRYMHGLEPSRTSCRSSSCRQTSGLVPVQIEKIPIFRDYFLGLA